MIKNLGDYFTPASKTTLENIAKKHSGLDDADEQFIVSIKNEIDCLLAQLKGLREISPTGFKEDEQAKNKLQVLRIEISRFERFQSEKSKMIIDSLNDSLDTVLNQINYLQAEIDEQRKHIREMIEEHKGAIDAFLDSAGYKYKVLIEDDEDHEYKLRLQHVDSKQRISCGNQHLSYGERNAFALVLFMFEAISKKPDLIILDDPISSFDKNKKYAIMHMLFQGEKNKCLSGETVLMLTHDLEPIIDAFKTFPKEYPLEVRFLSAKGGELEEKKIRKRNLVPFPQICKKVMRNQNVNDIVKLIYLRRNCEILNEMGDKYQVVSNLLKKRNRSEAEDWRIAEEDRSMDKDKFDNGINELESEIKDFDYQTILEKLLDDNELKRIYYSSHNSHEKLQIFRLLNNHSIENSNSILRKFINESYHIENELIYQLNPYEYDLVPQFIIEECDRCVASIGELVMT